MDSRDTLILILLVALLILHVVPRLYVRRVRYHLARLVYWQWRKMSKLSAMLYWMLYNKVNGRNGKNGENSRGPKDT